MIRAITWLLVLFACPVWTVAVTGQATPLRGGDAFTIESNHLGEERTIWIWTPEDYEHSGLAYPVLYLLDGDVHFRHAIGTVEFTSLYLRAPEMIIVGVLNTDRGRDLIPDLESPQGGDDRVSMASDPFLQFLTGELKPFVDRRFRTQSFDVLVGHSLGGLFTVATFLDDRHFDAHIAISPSLYWNDSLPIHTAREALGEEHLRGGILYVALASSEQENITASTHSFVGVLEERAPSQLQWWFNEFPENNHLTVPYEALHRGVRAVFTDWTPPLGQMTSGIIAAGSLAPFDEHYGSVSEQYGFDVRPPELVFSIVGDRLYRDHLELAIALFRRRVSLYPNSPEAHDELGRGLEASGAIDEAVRSYERAVVLARAQNHPSLGAIEVRYTRALERKP